MFGGSPARCLLPALREDLRRGVDATTFGSGRLGEADFESLRASTSLRKVARRSKYSKHLLSFLRWSAGTMSASARTAPEAVRHDGARSSAERATYSLRLSFAVGRQGLRGLRSPLRPAVLITSRSRSPLIARVAEIPNTNSIEKAGGLTPTEEVDRSDEFLVDSHSIDLSKVSEQHMLRLPTFEDVVAASLRIK